MMMIMTSWLGVQSPDFSVCLGILWMQLQGCCRMIFWCVYGCVVSPDQEQFGTSRQVYMSWDNFEILVADYSKILNKAGVPFKAWLHKGHSQLNFSHPWRLLFKQTKWLGPSRRQSQPINMRLREHGREGYNLVGCWTWISFTKLKPYYLLHLQSP